MEEVTKLVKKQRFDAAIHVEVRSYAEQVDFKDLRSDCTCIEPKAIPHRSRDRRLIS